ncbi:lytic transglycosylase domain-containing protein [Pseudarthrobacter sp. AL07]|uniref:aggregation-promoting factor C-terminal-like domain-containing protein n=1 Tax=unclassified Pseudarthrobacter TaxID=2647000 RepID=UPI00249ADD5F|nr:MULTISPECIES: lytic transglycosylase domain-containing protein [unclassified Pseudarthrobacter]MDI3195769.1 lytic transglycosylase domain-containing protein [Pseudarthrobacter sp. AL20]MDI3209879.1 lytic transglycosylase domain-containing protein [Pseudarthrobacter sp. AL07]
MSRIVQRMRLPALAGMLAVTLVGSAAVLPSHAADDAPPGGYPSWQDVQNAKQSEAGKAAEVTRINTLLGGLQTEAEALGNAAVTSAAEYALAEASLQAATSMLDALTAQTARAAAELGQYKKEIGALAAQSYKTGGTNMGFFVALDAVQNNSIQGLNIVQIVSDKTAVLVNKSAAAERISRALADQEQAARAERERLSGEARTKLDAAQSAQQAMSRQIAEQQEHGQELTAQLASLKGTTAAVEGEFRQGQSALAAYETAQAAKRAAAQEQARQQAEAAAKAAALAAAQKPAPAPRAVPGVPAPAPVPGPTPVPPPVVVVPSVPGGAVNDPAGAKNYAAGQLASYGWGQDQFQCLASLWTKESNWLTTATNPYSGAYGIAQALPASKYGTAGSDWLTSYRTQVNWGLSYIADRYGSPCGAWNHSVANNWY